MWIKAWSDSMQPYLDFLYNSWALSIGAAFFAAMICLWLWVDYQRFARRKERSGDK
jgi:hypothetical protein